jgi:lipopolysaccharide export system protein LptA
MRVAWLMPLIMLLAGAGSAAAQSMVCDLVERPGGRAVISNAGQPTESGIIYRAHFICDGGQVTIIADTAMYSVAGGTIDLYSRVEVSNPERIMNAARATYFMRIRQLSARGGVVVTDRETGSVITGEVLNYLEAMAERPETQVTVTSTERLSRALLLRERDGQPGVRDTTVVDASVIFLVGDRLFRGLGRAVMTRDSLRATGSSIEYGEQDGRIEIAGDARVELPTYVLTGDSITATLGEDEEIREVLSRHQAVLDTEDLRVTASALRIFLEDGGVSRLVAMKWPAPMRGGPAQEQARAVAAEFRMEADSLEVLAPEQLLREAAAFGAAYVERITPDTLRDLLPDTEPAVRALIENDWVRGDTVRAFFTAAPAPAEPDVVGGPARRDTELVAEREGVDAAPARERGEPERVLERLWAAGTPAQTMHRTRDDSAPEGTPLSIAYLIGKQIEVTFTGGAVEIVSASEDVRGVYLQPRELAGRTVAEPPPDIPPEQQ